MTAIMNTTLSDKEFSLFQKMIYQQAGISMKPAKKALIVGRLGKRLRHYNLSSFREYYDLINSDKYPGEFQTTIDLLTTNETYFFREQKHFDLLKKQIIPAQRKNAQNFRVWSAASSSGQEAYTVAMVLAETIGLTSLWEVVGTDISQRIVNQAKTALFPMKETENIARNLLNDYCLKGVRSQQGSFLITDALRKKVSFHHKNLMGSCADMGQFDVIFLRNVMIYFDNETKQELVNKLITQLKPGGYFIIGHSETLNQIKTDIKMMSPSVYRKE